MMKTHVFLSSGTPDAGLEILSGLAKRAEDRVLHSDTFRQRNINFALVIFAGFIALGSRVHGQAAHLLTSGTLLALMTIFALWDRRWHKTKHGWQQTRNVLTSKVVKLANHPKKDVQFQLYCPDAEKTAEPFSFQPMIFYFLVLASLVSFFVFRSIDVQPIR